MTMLCRLLTKTLFLLIILSVLVCSNVPWILEQNKEPDSYPLIPYNWPHNSQGHWPISSIESYDQTSNQQSNEFQRKNHLRPNIIRRRSYRRITQRDSYGSQQYFRVKPVDMNVIEGDDVELECTVGNQKGSVQWSKDGFLLGFDPEIPGFPRYSMKVQQSRGLYNLKISNVLLEDEGDYQCQVGPAQNTKPIRAGAKLSVMVGPKEILILSSAPIIKLSSKAHSSSSSLSSSLSSAVPSSPASSEGFYHGLDVNYFTYPSIISSSESRRNVYYTIYAKEAQRVTLNCNTSSSTKPQTKLIWLRNNVQLKQDSYTVVITEGLGTSGKLSSTRSVLSLFVKLDDNGVQYSCRATHPATNRPITNTVSLSVLVPPGIPQIEGYTNGDQISAFDTLTLACISRGGNPLPKLIWSKNNVTVDTSYLSSVDGKESTNTYSFVVKPSDNNALITCEAFNQISSKPLTTTIKLTVLYAPSKIVINGPLEGKLGDKLNLECVVGSSNPAAEVSWTVDGRPVQSTHSNVAAIREGYKTFSNISITLNQSDSNSKTVTCYGTSKLLKETIFKTVQIQILYPPGHPTIIGLQNNTHLLEDEVQRLECVSVGGNPLATLKWYKGHGSDRKISGLPSSSNSGVSNQLLIRAKPSDNGAVYICEASNRATSEPLVAQVTLNVIFMSSSIKITSNPKYPKHGGDVRIFCETGSCNPICGVTWFFNGVTMKSASDETFDGQFNGKNTRSLLVLAATDKHDQSTVICRVTNKLLERSIEKNFQLRVLHKPRFSAPLFQKFDVIEDNPFIINMTATGFPIPLNYNWYKNGLTLAEEFSVKSSPSKSFERPHLRHEHTKSQRLSLGERITAEGPVLKISRVERYDGGEYECEVNNAEGMTKATLVLNVLFGATIVKTTEIVLTELSGSAQMACEAIGNPMDEMTLEWYKESAPDRSIKGDTRITIDREKGKSLLRFSDVQQSDEGYYICKAVNGIGKGSSARLKMALKYKPVILNRRPFIAIDEGQDIVLTCSARGIPSVHFKWVNSANEVIGHTRDTRYSPDGVYRYMVSRSSSETDLELFESKLLIRKVRVEDFGSRIKCIALNERGSEFTEFTLRPKSVPDPPFNLTVVRVDHKSITLSWKPGFDGGSPQTFKAKIRLLFDLEGRRVLSWNKARFSEVTNETTITISGLSPRLEYGVTIRSQNDLGQSESDSDEINFVTLSPDVSSSGSPLIDNSDLAEGSSEATSQAKLTLITVVIVMGLLIVIINCALILFCVRHKNRKWLSGNGIKSEQPSEGQHGVDIGPASLNKPITNNIANCVHLNGNITKATDHRLDNLDSSEPLAETIPMGLTSHAQLLDNGNVIVNNVINHSSSTQFGSTVNCNHHQSHLQHHLCDCNNKILDIPY